MKMSGAFSSSTYSCNGLWANKKHNSKGREEQTIHHSCKNSPDPRFNYVFYFEMNFASKFCMLFLNSIGDSTMATIVHLSVLIGKKKKKVSKSNSKTIIDNKMKNLKLY